MKIRFLEFHGPGWAIDGFRGHDFIVWAPVELDAHRRRWVSSWTYIRETTRSGFNEADTFEDVIEVFAEDLIPEIHLPVIEAFREEVDKWRKLTDSQKVLLEVISRFHYVRPTGTSPEDTEALEKAGFAYVEGGLLRLRTDS